MTFAPHRERIPNSAYKMHWGDVFFPGAQSIVFDWQTPLPPNTILGAQKQASLCGRILNVLQAPQVYINGAAYTVAGIGGVSAGQIFQQPLVVPNGQ